jgi:hypothetical protein
MFARFEKSPFDIPDLKHANIEKAVKAATMSGTSPAVLPAQLQSVTDQGFSIQNCASIITHILRLIDDFGSHTTPVYKSLCVLIACMNSQYGDRFARVARVLIPEIQTILCLSFGTVCADHRDQIHAMGDAIYRYLMFDAPLPDVESFGTDWQRLTHRIAPPPEADPRTAEPPSPEAADVADESFDSEELSFDPRASPQTRKISAINSVSSAPISPKRRREPEAVEPEAVEPPDLDAPLEEPGPPQPIRKTVKDLIPLPSLFLIHGTCYDDSFDTC